MLEAYEPRKRFNENFAYGAPMVDGPWDFGLNEEQVNKHTPPPAVAGGEQTEASELAAIPGIVRGTPEVSRANVAASALAFPFPPN
jgi:hypothetical protein